MPASETFSDDEIQDLVEGLFVPDRSDDCFEQLKAVGGQAVPLLVAAMRDLRVPGTAFHQPIPPGLPNFASPFYRISHLLESSGLEAAAVPFLELLNGADPRFQQDGAKSLGSLALEDCIEPVNRILLGGDERLRTYAMMGVESAIAGERGTPAFFLAIRPQLVNLLDIEEFMGRAPALLMQIDPQYAAPILLSPERLSLENPQLRYVFDALNEAHARIPHNILLPLIGQLEPLSAQYPRDYELA
jgi:hypothetical protein